MENSKLTFENFQLEAISRKEQKRIKAGGDDPTIDPNNQNEPKKTGGNGNN